MVNKPSFLCFTLFVLVCYIVSLLAINSRFHRWYLFRIVISCCMHCIYHLYITWVYKLLNIVTYFVSCNTCIINWLYAQHMLRVNLKTYVSFRESNKKKIKKIPRLYLSILFIWITCIYKSDLVKLISCVRWMFVIIFPFYFYETRSFNCSILWLPLYSVWFSQLCQHLRQ